MEKAYPQLVYPENVAAEITRAQEEFVSRFKRGIDQTIPPDYVKYHYPIHWYDLMDHDLCTKMQEIENKHNSEVEEIEFARAEEAYRNSDAYRKMAEEEREEKEELEKHLLKFRSYTGKEKALEANLCIPAFSCIDFFDIQLEVIRLAIKFGYDCPLTDADLLTPRAYGGEVEKGHPVFKKYEEELTGEDWVEICCLIEWEYEDAMKHLQKFVPSGYYMNFEEDYGWGVFKLGAFDYDSPY